MDQRSGTAFLSISKHLKILFNLKFQIKIGMAIRVVEQFAHRELFISFISLL